VKGRKPEVAHRAAFPCAKTRLSIGRQQAQKGSAGMKGQYSANQGMNVQEAIRFQTYCRTMLRAFRLSPLVARSSSRLLFGS
jgi:hypothetical protein